jgi:hypothetical protein
MRYLVAAILAVAAGSVAYSKAPASIPTLATVQQKSPVSVIETPSARAGSASGTSLADERWLGRAVHSSDGKYLGDVAALNEDDQYEFYVDLGDFLALGEARIIRIASDQLLAVHDDRIVLRLTEPEARRLPTVDGHKGQDL